MRIYFPLILILIFFTSCDDGEIIVTTFDFEEDTFEMCSNGRSKLLYHINSEIVNESLTIQVSGNNFSADDQLLINAPTSFTLPLADNVLPSFPVILNTTNVIVYRTYDAPVPTTGYFCSNIPPSTPNVIQEYRSVGGELVFRTNVLYNQTNQVLDHDGDGIPSVEEGMDILLDTDGDRIPDYLDLDDDGDNVRTTAERAAATGDPTVGIYLDTDEDGVPNYLDQDDDQDGIPTLLEVTEAKQDPRENFNAANTLRRYLDQFTTERYAGELTFAIENVIPVRYVTTVTARNLMLKNVSGDGEEISFVTKELGSFVPGTAASLLILPPVVE